MTQYANVQEYNRAAETERRILHNRKIDAIVENSLKGMVCDCGSGNMKQKKRGTYIVICNSCGEGYKLIN